MRPACAYLIDIPFAMLAHRLMIPPLPNPSAMSIIVMNACESSAPGVVHHAVPLLVVPSEPAAELHDLFSNMVDSMQHQDGTVTSTDVEVQQTMQVSFQQSSDLTLYRSTVLHLCICLTCGLLFWSLAICECVATLS